MKRIFFTTGYITSLLLLSSCSEDPKPVNEDELITTVQVDLTPIGGGDALQLKFFDEDGDGAIDPVITPAVALLESDKSYDAIITLLNESESPAEDVTIEIEEEREDHLFCFSIAGTDVTIIYDDQDDNGHPIGLGTIWTTGDTGEAGTVKITLRHQPNVKDGNCPGNGDTDVEVAFPVQVVDK